MDPEEREKFRNEELQLNVLGIYDKYEAHLKEGLQSLRDSSPETSARRSDVKRGFDKNPGFTKRMEQALAFNRDETSQFID